MSVALLSVFHTNVVDCIVSYYPSRPNIEWEMVYGTCVIWRTDHLITYGGGPEGGYVYFYKERPAGWYAWHRDRMSEPVYTRIRDGQMAAKRSDYVDYIGKLPLNWQEWDWCDHEDDEVSIMDDDYMQEERD